MYCLKKRSYSHLKSGILMPLQMLMLRSGAMAALVLKSSIGMTQQALPLLCRLRSNQVCTIFQALPSQKTNPAVMSCWTFFAALGIMIIAH